MISTKQYDEIIRKGTKRATELLRLSGKCVYAAVSTEDAWYLLRHYGAFVNEWQRSEEMLEELIAKRNKAKPKDVMAYTERIAAAGAYSRALDVLLQRISNATKRTGDLKCRALWSVIDQNPPASVCACFGMSAEEFKAFRTEAVQDMAIWLTDH